MYRLLIADETESGCEEIRQCLDWGSFGFSNILTASSCTEAVNKSLDQPPHVALVNVRLGEHFGWELAEQLRQQGLKTVFAMVSDVEDPAFMRASMQEGARDFFLRPLNGEQVRSFVKRVILDELGGSLPEGGAMPEKVDPVLGVEYQQLGKITNKIILYTRNNYRLPLSLMSIAEEFQMSSKYIGRVFLGDTGMKYSEYLMACRMLEAKKRIVGTQDKISVIANMVGYSQLNNFYIHFKGYFGISPGAMRTGDLKTETNRGENHE